MVGNVLFMARCEVNEYSPLVMNDSLLLNLHTSIIGVNLLYIHGFYFTSHCAWDEILRLDILLILYNRVWLKF